MKFSKEDLIDEVHETVYDKIVENTRWSIHHERVFKHDGKFYITYYSHGSTEMQNESPYEFDGDEIECEEVFPVERVVIDYWTQSQIDKQAKSQLKE